MQVDALLCDGSKISVEEFSYHGPNMALLHGADSDKRRVMVMAHYGSVHLRFTAVKPGQESSRPPVGFRMPE